MKSDLRIFYQRGVLALALLLLLLLANEVFGYHGWSALRSQKKEHESLEQEVQRLKQENQRLADQNLRLQSDPSAIEELARERMHFARPNETIIEPSGKDAKPTSPTEKSR